MNLPLPAARVSWRTGHASSAPSASRRDQLGEIPDMAVRLPRYSATVRRVISAFALFGAMVVAGCGASSDEMFGFKASRPCFKRAGTLYDLKHFRGITTFVLVANQFVASVWFADDVDKVGGIASLARQTPPPRGLQAETGVRRNVVFSVGARDSVRLRTAKLQVLSCLRSESN